MKKSNAEYWAPRITAEWRKSVEGILNVGRQLSAAKKACEHGEFMRLFKGSDNPVPEPVPFTIHTADRLMRIAARPAIADCAHAHSLPQSWATLYELAHLDDDRIVAGMAAGEITPEMTRADAAALRADPIQRPASPPHEAIAAAVKNAVTKMVGSLTTPAQFEYVRRRLEQMKEFLSELEAERCSGEGER
jgi:hypothetical protein